MHIVRNSKPIGSLPPGEWLFHDTNAFEMALRAERGTCEVRPWTPPRNYDFRMKLKDSPPHETESIAGNPQSILLIRSGAIGDLLMLSPCIAPLQRKYPNAKIHLSCNRRHWPITEGFGIDSSVYPMEFRAIKYWDLVIPLENVIELSTERGQHGIDAYAEALGVTVTDYRPIYHVTEQESYDANYRFPRPAVGGPVKRRPRAALQLASSSRIRDYPMQLWGKVVNLLLERDFEIMLVGNRNPDTSKMGVRVRDCSTLTFREAAAVLAQCDVFCGVDSSFFNLCPALDVPAVGIFGPVASKTRAIEALGQYTLDGVGKCAPCGWTNSRAGQAFPTHCPSRELGHCEVLARIKPEEIVATIEKVIKR